MNEEQDAVLRHFMNTIGRNATESNEQLVYVSSNYRREVLNYELELYKLITNDNNYVNELGWVSDKEFFVWVPYLELYDFMKELKRIFGYGLFDGDSFNVNMREDSVCIDLCEAVGDYLNLEDVFPRDKYQH